MNKAELDVLYTLRSKAEIARFAALGIARQPGLDPAGENALHGLPEVLKEIQEGLVSLELEGVK